MISISSGCVHDEYRSCRTDRVGIAPASACKKKKKVSISVMRLSHADMEVYTDIEKEPAGGQFTHRLQKRRSSPAEIR